MTIRAMPLTVLAGASGSGKTAISEAIETRRPGFADVYRFDQIGLPSPESMVAGWGSCEALQRAMTLRWMVKIAAQRALNRPVLFEDQMRLAFVQEGLLSAGIANARVILVDCDDETRMHRVLTHRHQPELASRRTMNWAAFPRREAKAIGCEVLDTSRIPLEASVEQVCALLSATNCTKGTS